MGVEAMTPDDFLALDAPTPTEARRAVLHAETIEDVNQIARHPAWPLLCLEDPVVLQRWQAKRAKTRRMNGQYIREAGTSRRRKCKQQAVDRERVRRSARFWAGDHTLASYTVLMMKKYGGEYDQPVSKRRKAQQSRWRTGLAHMVR